MDRKTWLATVHGATEAQPNNNNNNNHLMKMHYAPRTFHALFSANHYENPSEVDTTIFIIQTGLSEIRSPTEYLNSMPSSSQTDQGCALDNLKKALFSSSFIDLSI